VAAGGQLDTHRLKIWVKSSPGLVICMRYVVSKLRTFSAYVAAFSHIIIASDKIRGITNEFNKNSKIDFITNTYGHSQVMRGVR
jgi:hypothetical protein